MQVGGVGTALFRPYIYNTNTVNRSSLNKISAIPEDAASAKTDFTGLTDEKQNVNPLKKGETANLADILQQQFQMSRMNADRLLNPMEENMM